MSKNIVEEAKAEIKKETKKQTKTYDIWQIIRTLAIAILLMVIGAYTGIKIYKALDNYIDTTVEQRVESALKSDN